MPYVSYHTEDVSTMTEAAEKLGIDKQTFWYAVRSAKSLPEPQTKLGGRYYYSTEEFKQLQTVFRKLRKEGKLK